MLASGMSRAIDAAGLPYTINRAGSMLTLFFSDQPVVDFDSAKLADTSLFAKYFQSMLHQGIYLPPSQFEAMFISAAVDQSIIDRILTAHERALRAR